MLLVASDQCAHVSYLEDSKQMKSVIVKELKPKDCLELGRGHEDDTWLCSHVMIPESTEQGRERESRYAPLYCFELISHDHDVISSPV